MAQGSSGEPVLLVIALFSRHEEARAWARDRLEECFGPVALASPVYDFNQTDYYAATMGPELKKQLLAFARLVPPDCLAAVKRRTIELEREVAESGRFAEPRPLNLDPGILNLGKFLLATTKDQAHRVYLGQGIHAEVTLHYQAGQWQPWPWTYRDYRLPLVLSFLQEARAFYQRLRRTDGGGSADTYIKGGPD